MILHARSIGNDVHIRHNTTFGVVRRDQNRAIPILEDRVDIGCGVSILGAVRVGADACIGAHSVVLSSVPPGATVAGVPARIIREQHEVATKTT
jgi:serine O-acetyltransferase